MGFRGKEQGRQERESFLEKEQGRQGKEFPGKAQGRQRKEVEQTVWLQRERQQEAVESEGGAWRMRKGQS